MGGQPASAASNSRTFSHRGGYDAAALFDGCTTNVQRVTKYLEWLESNPATGSDIQPALCSQQSAVPDFSRNPKLGDELVCIASVINVAKDEKVEKVAERNPADQAQQLFKKAKDALAYVTKVWRNILAHGQKINSQMMIATFEKEPMRMTSAHA